jgi:hypothetical protein
LNVDWTLPGQLRSSLESISRDKIQEWTTLRIDSSLLDYLMPVW